MVIGNVLTTRKRHVVLYTPESQTDITISDKEIEEGIEIESKLIPELIHRHEHWK
jgi:phosphopantothenate-cysteine ligase